MKAVRLNARFCVRTHLCLSSAKVLARVRSNAPSAFEGT
jgi:hypothetical protein